MNFLKILLYAQISKLFASEQASIDFFFHEFFVLKYSHTLRKVVAVLDSQELAWCFYVTWGLCDVRLTINNPTSAKVIPIVIDQNKFRILSTIHPDTYKNKSTNLTTEGSNFYLSLACKRWYCLFGFFPKMLNSF